ncbi:unnamed protein product, partial [Closterium sp. Yama58-4]
MAARLLAGCSLTRRQLPIRTNPVFALPLLLLFVLLSPPAFRDARFDGVQGAAAAPFSVTDSYTPACGPLPRKEPRAMPHPVPLPPPPVTSPSLPAWLLWSRASTWAFMGGRVPGIGASVGANVTIPCGRAVLLDVPRVSLGLLVVKGWLRLLDNPFVPSISVQARFIIVYGRLSVGTEKHHFHSQATFTLVPNLRFGRSGFLLRQPAPANPAHPRSLGHKAFVVVSECTAVICDECTAAAGSVVFLGSPSKRMVGGQVDFHGMPGGASTPAWVRLAQRANKGARQITVDADVSAWPRGGVIAVASTTPDLNNAEKAIITGLRRTGPFTSVISLLRPLKHSHDGDRNAVRDGFGGTVVVRVEVALLTRSLLFLFPPAPLAVRRTGPSTSVITLYRPLKHSHDGERHAVRDGFGGTVDVRAEHSHDGERHAVRDGFGGTVDVRAEVALLTRNIVIQGVHEQAPYQYDGGHFMVYMTRTPQTIHGVQFKGLGNQGSLGKYPLHFHVCGNAKRRFLVRKNVILESKQRCIVVHATSRVTIADNVAYETRGHCFVLEEGSEARNTFIRNLGMSTRAVQRLIPPASHAKFDQQTDDKPSTFWLATPFNSFVGNVAAGSEDSGFWLELNKHMRGLSRNLPFWRTLSPVTLAFGVFHGNVIHSNALFGLRTYPHGARPMFPSKGKGRESIQVRISHSLIYSNPVGVFLYNSQSITISHSTFINNRIAIDLNRNFGILILACTFIGRTACSKSSGGSTPYDAASTHAPTPLMPSTHATPQLPPGAASSSLHVAFATNEDEMEGDNEEGNEVEEEEEEEDYGGTEIEAGTRVKEMETRGRVAAGFFYSRDGGTFKSPIGVMLSQVKPSGMLEANRVLNSRFSGFGECGPTLRSSALVLAVNKAGGFWNPAMSVKGLRFTSATRRLYAVPNAPNRPVPRGGSNARFYALHDADGSFLSSSSPAFPSAARPAYLVAPFRPILPPASVRTSLCQYHDTWSLYSCRSTCYRAIALTYLEYGVPNLTRNQIKKHRIRPYSTAKFTRLTDRAYFFSLGDRNDYSKLYKGSKPVLRTISATLLAGHAYSVEITPPSVNRGFYPKNMTVRVLDKEGCAGGLELRVVPRTRGTQWRTITNVPQLPCRGKGGRSPNRMYQRCTYRNKQPTLALSFGRAYAQYSGVSIVLGRMRSRTCPPV